MEKQINITINFPDADSLINYCKATGWSAESGITKKDWVKAKIVREIKETLIGRERANLETAKMQEVKTLESTINNLLIT